MISRRSRASQPLYWHSMAASDRTYIGEVASVTGAQVRVRLRRDISTTSLLVDGAAYRVGQVGAFVRIPLGYTQLFAVCTQVGADAAPFEPRDTLFQLATPAADEVSGYQWMVCVLFGESMGGYFDRGVGQYPTVSDEVHLVTQSDLQIIYRYRGGGGGLEIGEVASGSGIRAMLDLAPLVSRHCCVVGSTGSGKSNLITVVLEELASTAYPRARVLVIDPHGEYAAAAGPAARVLSVRPEAARGEQALWVPFWALPLSELLEVTMGGLQPNVEAAIRDETARMKRESAQHLAMPPPEDAITADSPIPFSIRKLWFDLDDFERQTFTEDRPTEENKCPLEKQGDAEDLKSNIYPPYSAYNKKPFQNRHRRSILRQLDLLRSRLGDKRFAFMFAPGGGLNPALNGKIAQDLPDLFASWIGHDRPITILDVSDVPVDILSVVVGTMLRLIYDVLLWAENLPVSGRAQPLLIVLEEAHRFVGEGGATAAHRIVSTIAKEGRKHGVGLMVVSQRPVEIDTAILSQCGTMVALRTANTADRQRVAAALPDELGNLSGLVPALRTGEALIVGEAMRIPTRVRIRRARNKPVGNDPDLPAAWEAGKRPDIDAYRQAVANWRAQTTAGEAMGEVAGA